MNKQELIEKAVIDFNGNLPERASALLITGINWNGSKDIAGQVLPAIETDLFFGYEWLDKPKSFPTISDEAWVVLCTSEEFNATADRMRNKPDWKDAPEWAASLAQDGSGEWWFYDLIVVAGGEFFIGPAGCRSRKVGVGKVIGDWRNTLEQRPVASDEKPDLAEWWDYENDKPAYDGALPPVGEKCQYSLTGCLRFWDCEIISHHKMVIKCPHLADDSDEGLQIIYGEIIFRPLDHDRNKKPCAEFCLRLANAKNEIDAAAKLCGKNKILADAVFAIGKSIQAVKKDCE